MFMKKFKPIPKLNTEKEWTKFWMTHDATEYMDLSKAKKVVFPNLKPTYKSISLRLPVYMLDQIKVLANKKDVPYQSLMKVFLAEKVKEELV
jgi:predicted DNA binding CopG/RHH family protein